MKIVAIMPVRNSDWILGLTARAVLKWCDHLVVLDHCSTDRTPEILIDLAGEFPDRLTVITESDPVWEEMRHRQRLLDEARKQDATHVAMIDDDEILTADLLPVIRDWFGGLERSTVMQMPWLCMRGSLHKYHAKGVWSEQMVSMGFVDDPAWHWSNSGRGGYDFHHRHPMGRALRASQLAGGRQSGLMHLQFVSGRRLRAKQALYQMTEVLRWPGKEPVDTVRRRYSLAVYGQQEPPRPNDPPMDLVQAPGRWWEGYKDLLPHVHLGEAPWQEAEALRLLKEHGPKRFAGLDLFGIDERFYARVGAGS